MVADLGVGLREALSRGDDALATLSGEPDYKIGLLQFNTPVTALARYRTARLTTVCVLTREWNNAHGVAPNLDATKQFSRPKISSGLE